MFVCLFLICVLLWSLFVHLFVCLLFFLNSGKSLKHVKSNKCIHPDGGQPRIGRYLVIWSGCDQQRLEIRFIKQGNVMKSRATCELFPRLSVSASLKKNGITSDRKKSTTVSYDHSRPPCSVLFPRRLGSFTSLAGLQVHFVCSRRGCFRFVTGKMSSPVNMLSIVSLKFRI